VSIDDGRGAVQVWVQKLNPVDHRTAVGKADASRARVLSVRSDPSSDDYFTILNGVLDYTKEQLVNLLTAVEAARISPFKRSQISAEDEWRDEGYLEGLSSPTPRMLRLRASTTNSSGSSARWMRPSATISMCSVTVSTP
jgi:hypothetical protein